MDKTTSLMIPAACGVVILIPVVFGVLWAKREAAVKECVISALTRKFDGDRSLAEIIYADGKDLDAGTRMMLSICKVEHRLFG
tara:strand:+ start:325 stop:573 length:249 start_codon:yes stop_codon:yes gene_type:complete